MLPHQPCLEKPTPLRWRRDENGWKLRYIYIYRAHPWTIAQGEVYTAKSSVLYINIYKYWPNDGQWMWTIQNVSYYSEACKIALPPCCPLHSCAENPSAVPGSVFTRTAWGWAVGRASLPHDCWQWGPSPLLCIQLLFHLYSFVRTIQNS